MKMLTKKISPRQENKIPEEGHKQNKLFLQVPATVYDLTRHLQKHLFACSFLVFTDKNPHQEFESKIDYI